MKSKFSNIFCSSNPLLVPDALWDLLSRNRNTENFQTCFADDIIFLPSRRAVRTVEKMIVEKARSTVLMPRLVPLGEGIDDIDDTSASPVSNLERCVILGRLIMEMNGTSIANAMPIARDLVRMMDYLENENKNGDIDWIKLVDDKYAEHFIDKAKFLDLAGRVLPQLFPNLETAAAVRNREIRGWIPYLEKYSKEKPDAKIIVCGSTGSVPATRDLMVCVFGLGFIILPGKIKVDEKIDTANPYFMQKQFLDSIGAKVSDISIIDKGESSIDFMNFAFSNSPDTNKKFNITNSFTRIDCKRESAEAEVVSEIAAQKVAAGKSVLVVSPDISAAQRLKESLTRRGIEFDFSSGVSGASTKMGRKILNLIDDNIYIEYKKTKNIYDAVKSIAESDAEFCADYSGQIWDAISELSDILINNKIELSISDLQEVMQYAISLVNIRPPMNENARVSVLGTIEARMQTADVVIMTGLNEGMFPEVGYENPWLPKRISEEIGLPPENRKVSLMALDFMTLSCAKEVFWTRAISSGGYDATESRFLSRVAVAARDMDIIKNGAEWISLSDYDADIPYNPMPNLSPRPPAINDDVYITELELLIHNPYAFYVRHILRLRPKDDEKDMPDARDFGNLVHSVIEKFGNFRRTVSETDIISALDAEYPSFKKSVLFHFWHKRFVDMAPAIADMLNSAAAAKFSKHEIKGGINIAGRRVNAIADLIYDNIVLDIKTGKVPTLKQLELGNMPQLPIEAAILQSGGFIGLPACGDVIIRFLQLQNRNVQMIEYKDVQVSDMINAATQKISELFVRYSHDFEPYDYYETGEEKYRAYDDLKRFEV